MSTPSLFPINRLPPDILGQVVFVYCLPTLNTIAEFYNSTSSRYRKQAPLTLCGVCHSWRILALSIPELWSQLAVRIENRRKATAVTRPHLHLVRLWLDRSGDVPLSLSLCDKRYPDASDDDDDEEDYEDDETGDEDEDDVEPEPDGTDYAALEDIDLDERVFQLFLAHIHRWHAMTIYIPHRPASKLLGSIPESGAPILYTAHIMLNSVWGEEDKKTVALSLSRLFSSSSNIHDLRWVSEAWVLRDHTVLWQSLVNIIVNKALTSFDIVQLLHSCRNLQTVVLLPNFRPAASTDTHSLDAFPHITHPHLRRIDWSVQQNVDFGDVFDKLTLPSLEAFAFAGLLGTSAIWSSSQLQQLFTRSQCSLLKLSLHHTNISGDELLSLLRLLPSLEALTVASDLHRSLPRPITCLSDHLIAQLTIRWPSTPEAAIDSGDPHTSEPFLSPKLLEIQFHGLPVDTKKGLIGEMVASRQLPALLSIPATHRPAALQLFRIYLREENIQRFGQDKHLLEKMRSNGTLRVMIQGARPPGDYGEPDSD